MSDCFANPDAANALPLYIARPDSVEAVKAGMPAAMRESLSAREFQGELGEMIIARNSSGAPIGVLAGAGAQADDSIGAKQIGKIARRVPVEHTYKIVDAPADWDESLMAIAWGLGRYKFTRYLGEQSPQAKLVMPDAVSGDEVRAIVAAINNGRDLINTPAGDMGPDALHKEAAKIADKYDAKITATLGEDLLAQNYPMIHAVGRAAHEAPRLIEFVWGKESDPKLTLVGKGITFDTGGLNIKSAAGARIMKKDMGGAAHALTLADMIMAADLPVRLHVLVAIAENAISRYSVFARRPHS